ncbi:MAG: isochorismatase family cysteine hydrolase, partial [Xanthobacteraceae bacterium]
SLTAMSLVSGVTPVMESAKIIDIWEKDTSLTRGWQAEVKRSRALGTLAARLEPVHTALILIDVQNDLCSAGGRLDQLGQSLSLISKTIPNIARLLESARAAGVKVFYLRSEHTSVTSNIGTPSWHMGGNKAANWAGLKIAPNGGSLGESCVRGSWGAEIVAAVAPLPEEIVITKHRYSGFTDTRLDQLLRSNEIRTVVVTGFMTNSSVESTARDAAMRDYYLVIGEDCVATPEDAVDLHSVSLRAIQNHFGLVKSSEQIASIWRRLSSSLKP